MFCSLVLYSLTTVWVAHRPFEQRIIDIGGNILAIIDQDKVLFHVHVERKRFKDLHSLRYCLEHDETLECGLTYNRPERRHNAGEA